MKTTQSHAKQCPHTSARPPDPIGGLGRRQNRLYNEQSMRDILQTLEDWTCQGHRFALATVTETWGSSPRPVGSMMAVRHDGLVCGSVSGGCVEGAVIDEALAALDHGQPRRLTFGALDENALWELGLSCGGTIKVWIDPDPAGRHPEIWSELLRRIKADQPCALSVNLSTGERTLGEILELQTGEEGNTFTQTFQSRERLIIVGASHIALPLISFARELGFETVLVDPRSDLIREERFPCRPDRIINSWPRQAFDQIGLTTSTYVVTLTHDPKIDDAALALALASDVAYIGALGSRTTQAKRRTDMAQLGFSEAHLNRIHGPVGLPIGARTPQEIALSIIAEIVQVRRAN
jgi:xanthine dehydrogenase accessory factor